MKESISKRKETPILMKGGLVRQTLAGNKTETRRIAKQIPEGTAKVWWDGAEWIAENEHGGTWGGNIKCPYGQPGDLLYVRETIIKDESGNWRYKADSTILEVSLFNDEQTKGIAEWVWNKKGNHCPSIHMPKAAARLWLEIIEIQCERLQEITEEEAIAEGVETRADGGYEAYGQHQGSYTYATDSFRSLWNAINAERGYGWKGNPWVWVVKYRITRKPKT